MSLIRRIPLAGRFSPDTGNAMPASRPVRRHAFISLVLLTALQLNWLAHGDVMNLVPAADTTLEQAAPTSNNGLGGPYDGIRAGGQRFGGMTRALMRFDIAGNIPAGATIRSAILTMTVIRTPVSSVASTFDLHRVLAAWGEGTNFGGPAVAGESSWNDRLGPGTPWTNAGGDYIATARATKSLAGDGAYDFTSASLVADVQSWLNTPAANFGWLLRSESEATPVTILLFGSRTAATSRPTLVIDFTPVAVPNIFALSRAGNEIRFSFNGEANRTYAVEFRDSLTTGEWNVLTNFGALPAAATLYLTNSPPAPERYFRIRTP